MMSDIIREKKGRRCTKMRRLCESWRRDWIEKPQAKKCQEPPEAERGKGQNLPRAVGGSRDLPTP